MSTIVAVTRADRDAVNFSAVLKICKITWVLPLAQDAKHALFTQHLCYHFAFMFQLRGKGSELLFAVHASRIEIYTMSIQAMLYIHGD